MVNVLEHPQQVKHTAPILNVQQVIVKPEPNPQHRLGDVGTVQVTAQTPNSSRIDADTVSDQNIRQAQASCCVIM